MIRKLLPLSFLFALAIAVDTAGAQEATQTTAVPSLATLIQQPLTLKGTLGKDLIQLHLRRKVDEDGGIEGQYFIFGHTEQVLVAGETDQDELVLEESRNGKDVSGSWEGKLVGNTLSGTWSSPDGSVTKPFVLTPLK